MSRRELEAAGITDPQLRAAYEACQALHAQHGRTYYLATRLLPPGQRPFVHALYGFARYADEIVDDLDSTMTDQQRADALARWGDQVLADLARGHSQDPIARALVDTATRFAIPHEHFADFLTSMRMDLTVTEYDTFADLSVYVHGSAAVIGREMVHVLGTTRAEDLPEALARADDLGVAFQLANFIRDVDEDLDRGRVYLPLDELARFEVSRDDLERRVLTPQLRAALQFQVRRVRELQARAEPGIALLRAPAQPCIEAASVLYCGIVDAVEDIDYQVFDQRATVGTGRRIRVAAGAWVRAVRARRGSRRDPRRSVTAA
ncbi:MAG: phytoene/squalene synthase family protein [Candidatus Nanopelagicales bacterium]